MTASSAAVPDGVTAAESAVRAGWRGRVTTVTLAVLVALVGVGVVVGERPADTWTEAQLPGVGAPVTAAGLEVTVQGVESGVEWVGDDESGVGPYGHFVKVTVNVANGGDSVAVFNGAGPVLIDDEDRSHFVSAAARHLRGDELGSRTEVPAGESVTGILLYDLPDGSVPTALEFSVDETTAPVRVELFV